MVVDRTPAFEMSNSVSRKGSMARNTPQPEKSTASSVHSEKSMRTAIMSPARFSRNQEKTELQNLNNRLAAYIDRVKYLETENSKLIQELNFSEEETNQNVSSIKVLFESELKDLRTAFDDQVKQKNRLELENERTTLKVKELRKKLVPLPMICDKLNVNYKIIYNISRKCMLKLVFL